MEIDNLNQLCPTRGPHMWLSRRFCAGPVQVFAVLYEPTYWQPFLFW